MNEDNFAWIVFLAIIAIIVIIGYSMGSHFESMNYENRLKKANIKLVEHEIVTNGNVVSNWVEIVNLK